jgi:hypothetical protein
MEVSKIRYLLIVPVIVQLVKQVSHGYHGAGNCTLYSYGRARKVKFLWVLERSE